MGRNYQLVLTTWRGSRFFKTFLQSTAGLGVKGRHNKPIAFPPAMGRPAFNGKTVGKSILQIKGVERYKTACIKERSILLP